MATYSFVSYRDAGMIQIGLVHILKKRKKTVEVKWAKLNRREKRIEDYDEKTYDKAYLGLETILYEADLEFGCIREQMIEESLKKLTYLDPTCAFESLCPFLKDEQIAKWDQKLSTTSSKQECCICSNQLEKKRICPQCKIQICEDCLRQTFLSRLQKNLPSQRLLCCVDESCGCIQPDSILLIKEEIEKYGEKKIESLLVDCKNCQARIFWDKEKLFQCHECHEFHCNKCTFIHDVDAPCMVMKEISLEMKKLGVKACPACKIPYVRTEGCNDIVCPECNINFCYSCDLIANEAFSKNKHVLFDKEIFPDHHCHLTIELE